MGTLGVRATGKKERRRGGLSMRPGNDAAVTQTDEPFLRLAHAGAPYGNRLPALQLGKKAPLLAIHLTENGRQRLLRLAKEDANKRRFLQDRGDWTSHFELFAFVLLIRAGLVI